MHRGDTGPLGAAALVFNILLQTAALAALLAAVAAVGWLLDGPGLTARLLGATGAGLLTAAAVGAVAKTRLGGLTGDVFGTVIELTMTMTLVVLVAVT